MSTRNICLIAGGGPAGSALAILLARQGRRVTLVEKSAAAQDRMCGEFFSMEGARYLGLLGVDLRAMGALSIDTVRLAADKVIAACPLPFTGWSLPRRIVDECLLQRAGEAGADVLRGKGVESLMGDTSEWTAALSDGTSITSHHAFIATGKHDLRGYARGRGSHNGLVAFKMYFSLTREEEGNLRNVIELILFPGGYAGLQLVAPGCANLSLLIRKTEFERTGSQWGNVLAQLTSSSAHLARRLAGAEPLLPRPLALSSIPYGYRRRPSMIGAWFVGDQAAVIPSFTGDGMSIALHSAFLAAEVLQRTSSAAEYQRELAEQLSQPLRFATWISQAMIAFPSLALLLRFAPGTMRMIAAGTRIPSRFLTCGGDSSASTPYPLHPQQGDI